jgi:hypothetical protein
MEHCLPGHRIRLTADEDSGARLLLALAFEDLAIRRRFPGGIWLEGQPIPETSVRGALLHIGLTDRAPSRPQDCALTLSYFRPGRAEQAVIGLPLATEAQDHLVAMGLKRDAARELEEVHRCVPKLIVLAGTLALRKVSPAAQMRAAGKEHDRYETLLRLLFQTMTERERTDLMRFQTLRPGAPPHDDATEDLAAALCWLCENAGGSRWLDPTAARWLGMLRPDLQGTARNYRVNRLAAADLPPGWHAYRNRWLLAHAYESSGVDRVLEVLRKEALLPVLLADRRHIELQLAGIAELVVDHEIDALLTAIRSEMGGAQLAERVLWIAQRSRSRRLRIALAVPRTEDSVTLGAVARARRDGARARHQ